MTASENPLVSILMPAYNCEKFIEKAIESILNQTYQNLELLIVDDKSTDSTYEKINRFNDYRIVLYKNDKNLGYLKSWNFLIAKAKGEFIAFQDADDYSATERIEKLLNEFRNNENISIVGSNVGRVDKKNNLISKSDFKTSHNNIYNEIPENYNVVGSALMIRREVYETIGGYNLLFDRIGAEDLYWIAKAIEKFKVKNHSATLYFYRDNPNSVSGQLSSNYRKMISYPLVKKLVYEIRNEGIDNLELNNTKKIDEYIVELERPFVSDPSFLYQILAKRYFNNNEKWKGIKMQFFNIIKKPSFAKLKDLIYYFKISSMNILKLPFTLAIRLYYKFFPAKYRIDKWKKEGKPAPPPREVKFITIRKYAKLNSCHTFVETGTYKGDTTNDASHIFKSVFSIELDNVLFKNAVNRFRNRKNVLILNGDSGEELEKLLNESNKINSNTLFWLDGHYSEGITAKGELVTPIVKELNSIKKNMDSKNLNHTILIDDAHLFNGTDDYPTLEKMNELANDLFPNKSFTIENNIIVLN